MTKAAARAEPGAGHPFLCFLNTVTDDGKSRDQNSFSDAAHFSGLMRAAGVPLEAGVENTQLPALIRLRETAYAAFSALAAGQTPDPADSVALSSALQSVIAGAELRITPAGLSTLPGGSARAYDQIVLSMEDLLRSDRFARLRECRRCTHLFLDQGRGIGRRWCSMARCGNRAKAESFRARQRDAA